MSTIPNIFAGIPASLPDELTQVLLNHPAVRIERIITRGHASPPGFWYDQHQDEWVLLLSGAARLEFPDSPPIDLAPGAYLHIPAHRRHRVARTDPDDDTIWLAIHILRT